MDLSIEELQTIYSKSAGLNDFEKLTKKHEYDYAQAGQIIAALKAGVSGDNIKTLENPTFDEMQMFFIRYGLERWDCRKVGVYAQPSFNAGQMREIILCYESGLDEETVSAYFTSDISAKAMARRRYGLLLGNGYVTFEKAQATALPQQTKAAPLPQQQFDRNQQIILNKAKESGLSAAQLHVLANARFEPAQMEQVLWGFEQNKLTPEQVAIYADPIFRADQMVELRKCLKDNFRSERVSIMASPRFSARQLTQLRLANDLDDAQFRFLAKPEIPAYKMGEYTMGFRQGYSIEQMQDME